jgi:hypothetical protein
MALWETADGMPPGHVTQVHPGDWRNHHIAVLPHGTGRGDFTPQYVEHDIEETISPLDGLLERLAELFDVDHQGALAARGQRAVRAADFEAG